MKLDKLEIRVADIPFPVREIHLNDCQIGEFTLSGIKPEKFYCWGRSRIGRPWWHEYVATFGLVCAAIVIIVLSVFVLRRMRRTAMS
jgi:hypothetical protein